MITYDLEANKITINIKGNIRIKRMKLKRKIPAWSGSAWENPLYRAMPKGRATIPDEPIGAREPSA